MTYYKIRVTGTQTNMGNARWLYEDNHEIEAEGAGEALHQLITHNLWWDTLDDV